MKIYSPDKYPYITVVEIPKIEIKKINFDLCKQPKETLKQYYNRQSEKPDLLINGGFFDMSTGNTIFDYINEHTIINDSNIVLYGMGLLDNGELEFGQMDSGISWKDFIGAYPPLIVNGRKTTINIAQEINYNARRSILAYNKENIYLIAIELPGMNFTQMQDLLLDLQILYAINLDGGGSTKILHNGKSLTSVLYNRAIDNIIAIYLKEKEENQPTFFRVQVGAFSLEDNAKNFLEQIKAIPDRIGAGYKNAYIRKINGLYKVQVGAFSIKENAERVVQDLKKYNFNAFIVS